MLVHARTKIPLEVERVMDCEKLEDYIRTELAICLAKEMLKNKLVNIDRVLDIDYGLVSFIATVSVGGSEDEKA